MPTRHDLIHKAASLPVGHPKRKRILRQVTANSPMPQSYIDVSRAMLDLERAVRSLRGSEARTAKRHMDKITHHMAMLGDAAGWI